MDIYLGWVQLAVSLTHPNPWPRRIKHTHTQAHAHACHAFTVLACVCVLEVSRIPGDAKLKEKCVHWFPPFFASAPSWLLSLQPLKEIVILFYFLNLQSQLSSRLHSAAPSVLGFLSAKLTKLTPSLLQVCVGGRATWPDNPNYYN